MPCKYPAGLTAGLGKSRCFFKGLDVIEMNENRKQSWTNEGSSVESPQPLGVRLNSWKEDLPKICHFLLDSQCRARSPALGIHQLQLPVNGRWDAFLRGSSSSATSCRQSKSSLCKQQGSGFLQMSFLQSTVRGPGFCGITKPQRWHLAVPSWGTLEQPGSHWVTCQTHPPCSPLSTGCLPNLQLC